MSAPALFWKVRTIALSKSDILNSAKDIMQKKGLTDIKIASAETSGRTPSVHAFIGALKKKDPPSSSGGVATTAPPTFIVVFTAAGSGAKAILDGLVTAWDNLVFL